MSLLTEPNKEGTRGKAAESKPIRVPVFILCGARSGSTLLRYLLDAHGGIFAPAETNLSAALQAIHFMCHSLTDDDAIADSMAIRQGRILASETIGSEAIAADAQVWCDKSLTSVHHADYLIKVFPTARFICLYRNCTDFITSAVEASPWGFRGYGFESYLQRSPENVVCGLAAYWADVTELMLQFELKDPAPCIRVRYEDLVMNPTEELERMCKFLELNPPSFAPNSALSLSHVTGPGDHKIVFTTEIHTRSVSKPISIPLGMIPPPLWERIQQQMDELHYRVDSPPWEVSEERGALSEAALPTFPEDLRALRERVARSLVQASPDVVAALPENPRFCIHIAGIPQPWLIDLENRAVSDGQGSAGLNVFVDTQTLVAISLGNENMATALRSGRLVVKEQSDSFEGSVATRLRVLARLLSADLLQVAAAIPEQGLYSSEQ